jgi:uncharacterized alkaline shock family protein YloU
MSDTPFAQPLPSQGAATTSSGATVDAGERGALRVADKVVEKVTRAAVLGVPGVAPDAATTGTVGRALGRAYPHVTCSRAGDRARVLLEIALVWPAPAASVARQVCEAVTEELRTLAGVHVDEVRATVARIVDPSDVLEATGTTKERRVR